MGIISIWVIALAFSLKSNRRVEEVSLFGVSLISFIYLIMGSLGLMSGGTIIAAAFTAICFLYCAYKLFKSPKNTFKNVLSVGSIALFAYIVFFVLTFKGCGISHADNLTYWGIDLKFLYNNSAIRTNTPNFVANHPEGVLVWDYYILKTWIGYTESLPLAFHGLLDVILVFPLFRYARGKYKYLKAIALWIFILLIPSMAYGGYSSLLGDVPMSLSYAICCVALIDYVKTSEKIYIWQLVSAMYFVLSTKRGGIVVAACFMLIAAFVLAQKRWNAENVEQRKIVLVGLVAEIILVNALWIAKIDFTNIGAVMIATLLGLMLACVCNYFERIPRKEIIASALIIIFAIGMYVVIMKYLATDFSSIRVISNFFIYVLTYDSGFLGFSIANIYLMFVVFLLAYYKKFTFVDNDYINIAGGVGSIFACLLYLCIYLRLYVVNISPYNGENGAYMPSFPRYMAPIIYAPIILLIYLLLDKLADKKSYFVFLVSLSSLLFFSTVVNLTFIKTEPAKFYGFEQAGIELSEENNVLIVLKEYKSDNGIEWPGSFKYVMSPATTDDIFGLLGVEPKTAIEDWPSEEEFKKALIDGQFDYIYVQHFTDEFYELYGDMFPGLENFHSGMVYKVEYLEDDVELFLQ